MLFIYKPDLERYRAFVSDFLIKMIVKDMTSKEQQKQLLTDIMEADAKDGLYDQQTPEDHKCWLVLYNNEKKEQIVKPFFDDENGTLVPVAIIKVKDKL